MIFQPIASSSKGNAYLVADGECRILLECGIPFKRLQKALDYQVQELTACLITHEHKDHAGHVDKLIAAGVPVYATAGTINALQNLEIRPFLMLQGNNIGAPLRVGTFVVVPFRTFHDAREPVGFVIRDSRDEILVFATDTGGLAYQFPGASIIAVEANYQEERLSRNTRIPEQTIERIRNTHMEIEQTADFLAKQDLSKCREIWLLHLSDWSGDDGLFVDLVERAVPNHILVRCAPKEAKKNELV